MQKIILQEKHLQRSFVQTVSPSVWLARTVGWITSLSNGDVKSTKYEDIYLKANNSIEGLKYGLVEAQLMRKYTQ